MSHRTDRVFLAGDVARCEPQHHCKLRDACKRYLAALPPCHAIMIGAAMPVSWAGVYCTYHIPLSDAKVDAEPKRKVHPPIGSL